MMRFIYLILFTFSFSGFSQRTLEATFEQNEDGGAISKKGNPLIEYFIKDKDEKVIGSLILKNDESEFLYYNNRKEIVATELNKYTKEYFTPFELKDNISFISEKNVLSYMFYKAWNEESDQFDLFLANDRNIKIGVLKQNDDGTWSIYRGYSINKNSQNDYRIFSYVFDPDYLKKSSFKKQSNNKKVKTNKKSRNKWQAIDFDGIAVNFSQNQCIECSISEQGTYPRVGLEYFSGKNSFGLTFGIGESATLVTDEYGLKDFDVAATYGIGILYNILKIKGGLGYYSYNFSTVEDAGSQIEFDFYDYTGDFYYSIGLQLNIPLGRSGITLDVYENNFGLAYGVGIKF